LKSLLCLLFGHRYFVITAFSRDCRKIGCERCGRAWGMNDRERLIVEWDGELEELYRRRVPRS
jgi:hypothetical protein